jgi:hypothetical protein
MHVGFLKCLGREQRRITRQLCSGRRRCVVAITPAPCRLLAEALGLGDYLSNARSSAVLDFAAAVLE